MTLAPATFPISERARHLKPSATLAVTARVRELCAQGMDIIGFGAGEPDFDTPDHIKQAAIEALVGGRTGYQPVPGPPEVREQIALKLQRENGIECTAADIVISCGGKHSLYLALQAIVDPGREDAIPTPAWVSYRPMVELCDGEAVEVPGAVENDFKITPSQLEAAITERTVAVLLNSPSNPCGTMYAPDELRVLAEVVAARERVVLISDEIYEKLIYGGVPHFSPGSMSEIADRVITINALSKAYAMTGWRLGYACGPAQIIKAMSKLQSQMTSHATAFCYPAIPEALNHGAEAVEAMRQAFAERGALIHGLLTAMPGVVCPRPTGAFYAFPAIGSHFGKTSPGGRAIDSSVSFAQALLEEAHVAVVPGDDFGECAKTHIRMSFACGPDAIREGCRRLHEWLEKLGG